MLKSIFILLVCLSLLACQSTSTIKTLNHQTFEWSNGINVFYFLNTECPICQNYQGQFKNALDSYVNVKVYYVFCGEQTLQDVRQFAQYDSLSESHVLLDKSFDLAKQFKAKVTPQVVLTLNKNVCYSGKIDNRFESLGNISKNPTINYLNNALNSLRKNETIQEPYIQPVGCFIEPH